MLSRLKQADIPSLLILTIALALRIYGLDWKPPHFDEGINGWFVDRMRANGFYGYDPTNYHGPFHFYTLFASLTLFGRNLFALRLPAVVASLLSVWMLLRFSNIFSKSICRIAALFMAVSPAFVFYGRYSIHESWLLFFLLLTAWGILTLWKTGATSGLWAAGMGLTGMILTKETYIIHAGCLLLAAGTLRLIEMAPSTRTLSFLRPICLCRPRQFFARRRWDAIDLAWVLAAGLGSILFFYSGNFLNWGGLVGLVTTYTAWIRTGMGDVHQKGWEYWLTLICHFEWPAFLGLVACLRFVAPSDRRIRYLAIYALGCLTAYSLIEYKTPWCIIVILWPFYFLAAYLLKEIARLHSSFRLLWLGALAAVAFSAWQCVQLNFRDFVDQNHPYVYVQTFEEINEITRPMLALAQQDPSNYHLPGHILMESSFPLPWLLGDFSNFGYYTKDKRPSEFDAALLAVDPSRIDEVEAELRDSYYTRLVRVRNGMDPVKLYLRSTEFHEIFLRTPADFIPHSRVPGQIEIRKALPVTR